MIQIIWLQNLSRPRRRWIKNEAATAEKVPVKKILSKLLCFLQCGLVRAANKFICFIYWNLCGLISVIDSFLLREKVHKACLCENGWICTMLEQFPGQYSHGIPKFVRPWRFSWRFFGVRWKNFACSQNSFSHLQSLLPGDVHQQSLQASHQ